MAACVPSSANLRVALLRAAAVQRFLLASPVWAAVVVVFVAHGSAVAAFPEAPVPLLRGGEPTVEPAGDGRSGQDDPALDLVGTLAAPAVAIEADEDAWYVQLRLAGDPRSEAGWWGVQLDLDGDDQGYEAFVALSIAHGELVVGVNAMLLADRVDDPADPVRTITVVEGDDWRVQESGSRFLLELRVPWVMVADAGVHPGFVARLIAGSSTTAGALLDAAGTDLACGVGATSWSACASDRFWCRAEGCIPYPGGAETDLDGDGLHDRAESLLGTDPTRGDTDGDGLDDGDEAGPFGGAPRDTDGDGVLDVLDLDDDGDGISTSDELRIGSDPRDPDDPRTTGGATLQNGGACAGSGAGPGSSPWPALLVSLGVLGWLGFKRRRVAAAAGLALALFAITFHAAPTRAAPPGPAAIGIEHLDFRPAAALSMPAAATNRLLPHMAWSTDAGLYYAGGLLEATPRGAAASDALGLVDGRLGLDLGAAIGLFGALEAGLSLPMVLYQHGGDLADAGLAPGDLSGSAAGDLRLYVRTAAPFDRVSFSGMGLGLELAVYVPTGDEAGFGSDGAVRVEPRLVVDWLHRDGYHLAFNIGYQVRPHREVYNLISDDRLRWALAAAIPLPVGDRLDALVSVFGDANIGDPGAVTVIGAPVIDEAPDPAELALGVRARLDGGLLVQGTLGAGLGRGIGAPAWRLGAAISYAPFDGDADGDGVGDGADRCPFASEDVDGFQDDDGCADADDDGDGLADGDDACPREPEDADGFEDEDGCPDPDNDGDGVPDATDECPLEAEDVDGFQDEDGCPDPDNDGDGVLDASDACPLRAEDTPGGGADGCPEAAPAIPEGVTVLVDDRVVLASPLEFRPRKRKLDDAAKTLLDSVVALLEREEAVSRLRIEVDVGGDRKEARREKLGKRRASAIRKYLARSGLPKGMFEIAGGAAPEDAVRLVVTETGGERAQATRKRSRRKAKSDEPRTKRAPRKAKKPRKRSSKKKRKPKSRRQAR